MIIQHNISALNSYRNLSMNNNSISGNLEKLSSGYRINRAGDDAAGLAISEKMRAQITGLETAQANAEDGISLVQTAEGALTEVHTMLNRMVELAQQSANGTIQDDVDRENIQAEVDALTDEIDRISKSTNFNGINLLDGSMGVGEAAAEFKNKAATGAGQPNKTITFTASGVKEGTIVKIVSTNAEDKSACKVEEENGTITVTLGAKNASQTYKQADIDELIKQAVESGELGEEYKDFKLTISEDVVIATAADAASVDIASGAVVDPQQASKTVSGITVTANKAGTAWNTSTLKFANGTDSGVTIANDTGNVTVNLTATDSYTAKDINKMLQDAGVDLTVEFEGEKLGSDLNAAFNSVSLEGGAGIAAGGGLELQIGDSSDDFNQITVSIDAMDSKGLGISDISLADQASAQAAVEVIKNAINTVSSQRGELGAIQNRLEHTINNLGVTAENMTAAESRIRDVDMAKEMMEYTKNNILIQSSQAMLAQANQLPQGVLQLLQ